MGLARLKPRPLKNSALKNANCFRGRRIEWSYFRFEKIQDGGRHHLGKISNGHTGISATGCPIHFMFGSRVGFSGTTDLITLFPVRTNPRWRPPPSWIISNGHISATAYTIYLYSAHYTVIFAIAQLSCIFNRHCNFARQLRYIFCVFVL